MACSRYFLYIAIVLAGWSAALGEELAPDAELQREPRHSLSKKKCIKYGICNGYQGGYNNYQGGSHGYQNGYQGGVPINIAISQSQSSANGADGGHSAGYYPNNYQYNGYKPGYGGYNQGYGGYNQGYGGYNHGYNGYRPGFGNGFGSYNSQFNGNYYGGALGHTGNGGYGFQGPFYDEDSSSHEDGDDDFSYGRSASAVAKSSA